MQRVEDMIVALATPVGSSAIALIRITGPGCAELALALFRQCPPARVVTHTSYYDLAGSLLDDVLITFFQGPRSYTGEDALEISTHGNPFIAQRVIQDLLKRGCRSADPGEFTRRAFLNGRLDLAQAEAVMDIIQARSERALWIATRQLRGSLGRQLDHLVDQLNQSLARIEAYIDFPDEDLPAQDRVVVRQMIAEVLRGTDALLATRRYGELLRAGVRAVLIGEPNAGKSSLFNRLAGRDRALVSPEPGTTRDYIEADVHMGAHAVRLVDTAGLNENPGKVEALGIAQSLEQLAGADVVLWVRDVSIPSPPLPPEVVGRLDATNTLEVWNKADLRTGSAVAVVQDGNFPVLEVSALTGYGLDELRAAIVRLADGWAHNSGDEEIAINARHADGLRRTNDALHSALMHLANDGPVELLSSDVRAAINCLGEITGRVDPERMLDHLFATFCIGK